MSNHNVRPNAHTSNSGVIRAFRKIEPSTGETRKGRFLFGGLNEHQLNKGAEYARR